MFKKAMLIKGEDNTEYIIMSVINDNNKEYALANKFDDKGKPTLEYRVFINDGKEITIEEDDKLINKLLPLFQKEIDKDLKEILNDK